MKITELKKMSLEELEELQYKIAEIKGKKQSEETCVMREKISEVDKVRLEKAHEKIYDMLRKDMPNLNISLQIPYSIVMDYLGVETGGDGLRLNPDTFAEIAENDFIVDQLLDKIESHHFVASWKDRINKQYDKIWKILDNISEKYNCNAPEVLSYMLDQDLF